MKAHRSSLAALTLGLLLSAPLAADGFIYVDWGRQPVPIPTPRPVVIPMPRPEYPLQVVRHRVEARIEGQAARTRIEETFRNPNPFQLEGTYYFPLPPGAAVSRFSMLVGGKEITGEVLERDKAREIYESIVRQSRDPGLLEFVQRGLFRARVFPIPASGDLDVRIEYEETLAATGGLWHYRYPLNTGKYSAGEYRDVLIDVTLRTPAPLRFVSSPSYPASVTRTGDREARVVFEAKSMTADKDFILDWSVGDDALAPVLLTHRTHEPEGFFLLTIDPRPGRGKAAPPKDLVAVIDTSSSMAGPKMEEARRALHHFVRSLRPGDRFNIVDFATVTRRFSEGLLEVNDETRRQAQTYVDGLVIRGGTNIEEALRHGLEALEGGAAPTGGEDRLRMLVFITDGEPTVGVTRPEEILKSAREKNTRGRRIFVFGIGVDLNAQLLERMAGENRGALDYVLPGENIEVKLSAFWDKIQEPVLTDLSIEFPGQSVNEVFPRQLPDLFRGDQLTIAGRFRDGDRRPLVLRGKFQGEPHVFEYSLDFSADGGRYDFVPRLWATRKIGFLLESIRLAGESKEAKDEVIRLSQQYGILTPYTSYLILEEGERRRAYPAAGAPGLPSVDLFAASDQIRGAGGAPAPAQVRARKAGASLKAERGEDGVTGSRDIGAIKQGSEESAREFLKLINKDQKRVQQVGARAFYFQDDRWIEGGIEEKDIAAARKVRYLSDEYFDLLSKNPKVGELLAVGAKVVFRADGEVIAVVE